MPGNEVEIFQMNITFFTIWPIWPHRKIKEPAYRGLGNSIYNFARPSIIIYYFDVWSIPRSREEDFDRSNAFSLYDLYVHGVSQESLPQG